jgi:hypothetical protein
MYLMHDCYKMLAVEIANTMTAKRFEKHVDTLREIVGNESVNSGVPYRNSNQDHNLTCSTG